MAHDSSSRQPFGLWAYALLFVLALAVRTAYFLELVGSPVVSTLLGDGRSYHQWALEIASGDWLGGEVFYQAPLYPYFLAIIYVLVGPHAWAARLVQAVAGSLSCVLLGVAGRRFFSPRIGWLAGVLLALYPPALFFDGLIQKAALGLLFLTALLAILSKTLESPARRWPFLAGLSLAGLALLRENALLFIPVVALWIVTVERSREGLSKPARALLLLTLGLATLLIPVGLRNQIVGGEFLITTSQSGSNFYIGNNANANGRYVPLRSRGGDARVEREDAFELAEVALGRSLTPREVSSFWWSRAFEFVRDEPREWIRLMIHKARLVWHAGEIVDTDAIEAYEEHSRLLWILDHLLHFGVICPLAALGLWLTRDRWRRLWVLYALVLVLAASLVAFYVVGRYRYPLAPILILFAAEGVVESGRLILRLGREATGPLAGALAAASSVALIVNWPLAPEPDPRATTYLNLGLNLTEEQRFPAAIEALDRAVELAPEVPATHQALARGHNRHAGFLIARDQLDEASFHLRRVIEIGVQEDQPTELALAHNQLANILAYRGQIDAAVEEYQAAVRIDGDLADARFKLGSLLADSGRLEEAIPHLEAAASLLPDFAAAHLSLGRAQEQIGERRAALAAYRRAFELEPRNMEAAEALGRLEAELY